MDIGEDGNLDIVAYTFDESTKQNVKSVILYNNFNNDAFFLKSLGKC